MTSLCRHLSAQEIVNWVRTADGCVHTADATKQFRLVGVGGVYWALNTVAMRRGTVRRDHYTGPAMKELWIKVIK